MVNSSSVKLLSVNSKTTSTSCFRTSYLKKKSEVLLSNMAKSLSRILFLNDQPNLGQIFIAVLLYSEICNWLFSFHSYFMLTILKVRCLNLFEIFTIKLGFLHIVFEIVGIALYKFLENQLTIVSRQL